MSVPRVVNLFDDSPLPESSRESQEELLSGQGFRFHRIVSRGEASPPGFWYDQEEEEWVLLARGEARLLFEADERLDLRVGDYLRIPAGMRHRVESVSPEAVWLALHFQSPEKER